MKQLRYKIISVLLILSTALLSAACGQSGSGQDNKGAADEATAAVTQAAVTDAETQPVTEKQKEPSAETSAGSKTAETAADTSAVDSALQESIQAMLEEYGFAGVYRMSRDGKVVCEGANGVIGSGGEAITLDNLFPIASISKQFCATCILLLRDEGKLSLDDTLDKYYPAYARGGDITLKQMLTMRSGIDNYVSNDGSGFDAYIDYDFGENASEEHNHQAVRDWIFGRPLLFEPGEGFYYSDSNYFLLAEIVQTLSGKPYGDVLRERIFDPLGMNDTGVCEELAHAEKTVPPVSDDPDGHKEIYTVGATFGNGGIITTAADMDKWLTSLRENTILSEKSKKEMTTVYSPEMNYGYGICIHSNGALSHEGGADSYASFAYTDPAKKINFFIVTDNIPFLEFRELYREILLLAL